MPSEYEKERGKLTAQLFNGIAIWFIGAGAVGISLAIAIAHDAGTSKTPAAEELLLMVVCLGFGVLLHFGAQATLRKAF